MWIALSKADPLSCASCHDLACVCVCAGTVGVGAYNCMSNQVACIHIAMASFCILLSVICLSPVHHQEILAFDPWCAVNESPSPSSLLEHDTEANKDKYTLALNEERSGPFILSVEFRPNW